GSGKSVTALAVFRLIRPPGRIAGGSIRFDGRDLLALPEEEMRRIRVAQIARLYRLHQGCSAAEARRRTLEMLGLVGIPEPERRARDYAHQLSGGMCQRVMIAMALATSPRLLLADEPTTGLDVSIAAQILDLLRDLGRRTGASIVLITHDLGVVAGICDRVAVMHAGQLVECADVRSLFREPAHPYTRALVRSIPRVDREVTMEPVPGVVPSLLDAPPGCRYADRCPDVLDVCRTVKPARSARARDHEVACYATEAARVAAPRG